MSRVHFGKVFGFFVLALILAVTAVPFPAHAATGGVCGDLATEGLGGVVSCIMGIFDIVLILLVSGSVIFTVYGAFQMIASEEKREAGKQRVYHGIIGLFVMTSIWGFVNILDATFSLSKDPISPPALRTTGSGGSSGDGGDY